MTRPKRLDDAKVRAAWLQMGSQYGSLKALAERFGCSPSAVSIAVKRHQATLPDAVLRRVRLVGKKPSLSPAQRAFVRDIEIQRAALQAKHAEELKQFPTHIELAEKLDVHVQTIRKAARGEQYKHDRVAPNFTQEIAR